MTVRWGLLATARIGSVAVRASRRSERARFVAVASRSDERARRFAAEHDIGTSHGSYEALLASDAVDAIYIALPPALHVEWTMKALEAGKHVLCEKPFSNRPDDVARAFDVAERTGLVCAEALAYRLHPRIALVQRLLADGAIGTLKHVRTALTVRIADVDIRRIRALGGGSLLDLGCYCVSAARLLAGEPERVFAEAVTDGAEVDMRFAATMRHGGGVTSQFDVGFELPRRDELELIGTDGRIVAADPWICRPPTIELGVDGRTEAVAVDPEARFGLAYDDLDVYRIELDTISDAIEGGAPLAFGRTDAVDQARTLDALLRSSERVALVVI
ncbi:MAG TPA: Gfo/Idh/MocA family oxidoreductase [Candidatus Limnocylindrales bacterium]|nr:Gfo/Idh/MocA family oxidoreductase [Candidatus Limnocylindrales bacterium]